MECEDSPFLLRYHYQTELGSGGLMDFGNGFRLDQ